MFPTLGVQEKPDQRSAAEIEFGCGEGCGVSAVADWEDVSLQALRGRGLDPRKDRLWIEKALSR
jgi:hypothetical protein